MSEQKELKVRKPDGYFLKKNLECLPEKLANMLHSVQHAETKVDPDIIIQGIKNPIVSVFIGLSTSHLITALKRKKKRIDNIIVIEPNLSVFKELVMTEDISDYLADPRVDFIVGLKGSELLTELFKTFSKVDHGEQLARVGKIQNMEKVVDPFVYTDLEASKEAQEINKIVDETLHHLTLSMGCPDDQSRRWELMIENRHNMFKAWNASGLKGKFDETTSIVLGGGPSLNDFIEAYHKHDSLKNCLILAADAVLHKLLDAGIKPHIVFRCERKKTQIFKGVTKEMTKGIYYAAYPWTPPEFFDLFDDHFYLFRNNGCCLFTGIKHNFTDGGVSSGNAAFEFALGLGSKNILTAGIDLVLIDGKTHVEGTQVEFNPNNSKAQWTKIKDWAGNDATTIPVWNRCRNEYGQSIDKHRVGKDKHDFKVYQTSLKSGQILGAEYKAWDDCAKLCEKSIDIDKRLETYRTKLSDADIDGFYTIVKEANKSLTDIREACNVTIELESDAKRTYDQEMEKIIRRVIRETCKPETSGGRPSFTPDARAFITAVRQMFPNIEKLSKNIADNYDTTFKMKYCNDKYYRVCLMDILQHDVFLYENKCNSLTNTREYNDEKYLDYALLTKDFLDRVEFYSGNVIDMFKEVLNDERAISGSSKRQSVGNETVKTEEARP